MQSSPIPQRLAQERELGCTHFWVIPSAARFYMG